VTQVRTLLLKNVSEELFLVAPFRGSRRYGDGRVAALVPAAGVLGSFELHVFQLAGGYGTFGPKVSIPSPQVSSTFKPPLGKIAGPVFRCLYCLL